VVVKYYKLLPKNIFDPEKKGNGRRLNNTAQRKFSNFFHSSDVMRTVYEGE
jgi:hypothetical protein